MPKLTPEELREAKRKKAEEQRQQEEAEEARLIERERRMMEREARERELKEKHAQLTSYVNGIYDEIVRLSNKWPTQQVSALTLNKANRALRSARELLADENDEYLEEIEEFIPAGDLPEGRDVALALRQVIDALKRMGVRHANAWRPY